MKKNLKKLTLIGTFAFVVCTSLCTTVDAAVGNIWVEKYYKIDKNRITNKFTNKHDIEMLEVPSTAEFINDKKELISSGWNYDRYKVTNFYQSHAGFH